MKRLNGIADAIPISTRRCRLRWSHATTGYATSTTHSCPASTPRLNADPTARYLYCGQLIAEADYPIEGALSRGTRAAMRDMATAWMADASPAADMPASAFVTLPPMATLMLEYAGP